MIDAKAHLLPFPHSFVAHNLGIGVGRVVFLYNFLDLTRTAWEGPQWKPGKHTLVFDFTSDGPGLGKGGTGVLKITRLTFTLKPQAPPTQTH